MIILKNLDFIKNKFNNLNIGAKYIITIILISLLFILSTTIVYNLLLSLESDIVELNNKSDLSLMVKRLETLFSKKNTITADYIISQGKNIELKREFREATEEVNQLLERLRLELQGEKIDQFLAAIIEKDRVNNQIFNEDIISKVEKSRSSISLWLLRNKISVNTDNLEIVLKEFDKLINQDRIKAMTAADRSIDNTIFILIISVLSSIALGAVLITIISKVIKKNLNKIINISNQVALGNLSVEKIDYNSEDEIGKLSKSINTMVDNLRNIIGKITTAAEDTSTTSEELHAISENTSTAINQIAASSQEFSLGNKELVDYYKGVVSAANEVNDLSQNGLVEMKNTQIEMKDVLDSSYESSQLIANLSQATEEIEDIVEVISNISEQTNLLALNAAIEAARAGQYGRGFAVVADEIRALSTQTRDSIDDIRSITERVVMETKKVLASIEANNSQIVKGSKRLDESEDTFNTIAKKINGVLDEMKRIAQFSNELSIESKQISDVTKEQSIAMGEITGSAEELSALSQELDQLIKEFKL
ncbi:methyl-accepting chemotaxis protein [Orenia metallireducens]|uniref:Methyl-accepting chemotaxis protein n=1 Tax=Orenia metallireducens TaxID=1413210 RepID=A0A285FZZ3_9FIRM|nr:methyl-accepting chemotaxis protein [Orenia metallireducens]SNY15781.1 Methyl-accepting chemotaxis protein [Orenia metallireducens]